MQSTTARIGLLAALVAVAVVLFIVLSGDDDNDGETTTTTAQTTTEAGGQPAGPPVITVRGGKPVGGVQDLSFNKGDRVQFEVRLDQPAEEVHVHGYEIEEPAATSPVRFNFAADIDGVFEVEVHEEGGGDVQIAELTVNP
ncbi:MAG: hypothetical protein ACRDK5_03180 [Solirubrobacterales bacterium]